jgi:Protein of unknown function (DUF4058)
MPMHNWKSVDSSVYHHFHQQWAMAICNRLNAGMLPTGYSALVEQHAAGLVPDVLAIERGRKGHRKPIQGNVATLVEPRTRLKVDTADQVLVRRASRIAIRHRLGDVVCMIEIVSPGNKAGKLSIRSFVAKTLEFLRAGVNVLVVDPFPPTPRDPQGLHKLIWDGLVEQSMPFELPPGEPLLMAAYKVGDDLADLAPVAYLEPFKVGANLADMPAWLDQDYYVNVPLESAYQTAWDNCPADMRYLVEHGKLPDEE